MPAREARPHCDGTPQLAQQAFDALLTGRSTPMGLNHGDGITVRILERADRHLTGCLGLDGN